MELVEVPETGLLVPVPTGWQTFAAADLADPRVLAELVPAYPGMDRLLDASTAMGERASIAFLAVDGSDASVAAPVATTVSIFVSQPSVSGILLDFVAGFIIRGIGEMLGTEAAPERARIRLPVGEAVRFVYAGVEQPGERIAAVGWVIGAPAGTILLVVTGRDVLLDALDLDALAAAVVPLSAPRPTP
jgi:hypothetical protein